MLDQQMIMVYHIITLAALAQFVLFVEVLKFSILLYLKSLFSFSFFLHVKENQESYETFRNILTVKKNIQN